MARCKPSVGALAARRLWRRHISLNGVVVAKVAYLPCSYQGRKVIFLAYGTVRTLPTTLSVRDPLPVFPVWLLGYNYCPQCLLIMS